MTMSLIETITLGSSAASIEFTSIPQDGTDLYCVVSPRDSSAGWTSTFRVELNNNTAASARRLFGYNGAVGSGTQAYTITNANGSTSNTFSSVSLYLTNYAGTTNKSMSIDSVGEGNSSTLYDVWHELATFSYSVTTGVTSLKIYGDASLLTGSTASLYKITKA